MLEKRLLYKIEKLPNTKAFSKEVLKYWNQYEKKEDFRSQTEGIVDKAKLDLPGKIFRFLKNNKLSQKKIEDKINTLWKQIHNELVTSDKNILYLEYTTIFNVLKLLYKLNPKQSIKYIKETLSEKFDRKDTKRVANIIDKIFLLYEATDNKDEVHSLIQNILDFELKDSKIDDTIVDKIIFYILDILSSLKIDELKILDIEYPFLDSKLISFIKDQFQIDSFLDILTSLYDQVVEILEASNNTLKEDNESLKELSKNYGDKETKIILSIFKGVERDNISMKTVKDFLNSLDKKQILKIIKKTLIKD